MQIKLKDIPQEGRDIDFELELDTLNQRIAAAQQGGSGHDANPCVFMAPVKSQLKLLLEGSSVMINGKVSGVYMTKCARCAEDTQAELDADVGIVLQPKPMGGAPDEGDEDVAYGFYEDNLIQCGNIVEEFLILALPYSVQCSSACKGLCMECGQNLNLVQCECVSQTRAADPRFAALEGLKLKH